MATGVSFTAVMVIVIAAAVLSSSPSFTIKVKLSLVAESDVLMYTTSAELVVKGKSSSVIIVSLSLSVPLVGRASII